jgi:hypothetical protein
MSAPTFADLHGRTIRVEPAADHGVTLTVTSLYSDNTFTQELTGHEAVALARHVVTAVQCDIADERIDLESGGELVVSAADEWTRAGVWIGVVTPDGTDLALTIAHSVALVFAAALLTLASGTYA